MMSDTGSQKKELWPVTLSGRLRKRNMNETNVCILRILLLNFGKLHFMFHDWTQLDFQLDALGERGYSWR